MQPRFGLVEHYRLQRINDRIGDLASPMRGQTMHEYGPRRGLRHQSIVDLIRGEDAGAFGSGSQIGASLIFLPGAPLRLAAGYLDSRDAVNTSAHLKSWTAGGSYAFGGTTVMAGWAVNRQDANFVGNFPNGPFSVPELTALKFNTFAARKMERCTSLISCSRSIPP